MKRSVLQNPDKIFSDFDLYVILLKIDVAVMR